MAERRLIFQKERLGPNRVQAGGVGGVLPPSKDSEEQ